jgi:hypothetical protein
MEQDSPPTKSRQTVTQRIIWFLAGAVVNYLLISTPFNYLRKNTDLSVAAISACSIGVSTTFFFCWNYFVNFRTGSRKRVALARYLVVVLVMYAVSTTLLTLFKSFDANLHLQIRSYKLDLDIITVQLCLGWVKFLIYHKWAFPLAKEPRASTDLPDKTA